MGLSDQAARRLLENRLETVLIELRHPDFSCILIDDYQGGCLVADYLHRRGHQNCAFFGPANLPDYSIHPEEARLNGFRDGLRNRGVDLPPELILLSSQSVVLVRRELSLLMDSAAPPTAIFAASDSIAISILRAARESGIRVPDDLAVVGFDDIDMAEQIGLTTVRQSLDESGRMAAELLTAQLADPNRPPQTIQLGLKLVERETA
jgi:LacI family transcriptional regulator